MRRIVWAACVAALCALAQPAWAQMADALGKPLPASELEAGTVTVRVVDGAASKPLVGVAVDMVASDGAARTARTDAEGRATFARLAPGAVYRARVTSGEGEAQKTTESEALEIPSSGGLRVMLSTSPWQGGDMAGVPAAGGMSGMPDPREMSGIPRPQPGDPAGQLTVRVVRGQMSNNVADHPVHLVGYDADGGVSLLTQRTDAGGRAVFQGLARDRVAYYAMTVLPRQRGDRAVGDRVRSSIVMMPPEVGVRLLLAGEAEDGAAAPVDDLDRIEDQDPSLGPGEALVRVFGQTEGVGALELVQLDGGGTRPVAQASLSAARPSGVRGMVGEPEVQSSLTAGALGVTVSRVTGSSSASPVTGATVEIEPVSPSDTGGDAPSMHQLTNTQGLAVFAGLVPGARYRPVISVHGTRIEGAPFLVPESGGLGLGVNVAWSDAGGGEARFRDVPVAPDAVYYGRAQVGGRTYLTAPFQMVAERGASLRMVIIQLMDQPIAFSFHTQGIVDDVYMAFQSQLTIHNYSYAPWDPGPEGLVIPLPAGFVGAQVEDEMSHRVGKDPDRGFLWRGPVPPGGARITGWYSLPIDGGTMRFDLPLPHGAMNSMLILQQTPGMKVDLPPDVQGRAWSDPDGRQHYVIRNIDIRPEQRMVLTAMNLPQPAAWQRYVSWGVGAVVVGLLIWGLGGVFVRRKQDGPAAAGEERGGTSRRRKLRKRREHLLDELVALEASKGALSEQDYEKRRTKLTRQLESIYHELDVDRGSAGKRPRA